MPFPLCVGSKANIEIPSKPGGNDADFVILVWSAVFVYGHVVRVPLGVGDGMNVEGRLGWLSSQSTQTVGESLLLFRSDILVAEENHAATSNCAVK